MSEAQVRRRSLCIVLIVVVALLSIGQAYHYHPHGGNGWTVVAFPFTPSTADASDSDGHTTSSSLHTCLLHFWSFLFSTMSILLFSLLLPPVRKTNLSDWAPQILSAWTRFPFSIRGPPPILS